MPKRPEPEDLALRKGLPGSVEAERMVLGSVILNDKVFPQVAAALRPEDFNLTAHQRIYRSMLELHEKGRPIDYMGLTNRLEETGKLELIGGISYISSLTDGMPRFENVDSYVGIVRDKALRRRLILECNFLQNVAIDESIEVPELLQMAETGVLKISQASVTGAARTPHEIVENYPDGGREAFLDHRKRTKGSVSLPFFRLQEMTQGFRPGQLILLAGRPGMGKSAAALNIAHWVAAPNPDQSKPMMPVLFFSLEMSEENLTERLAASIARVDYMRFMGGYLNADEKQRMAEATASFKGLPMYFQDTSDMTVLEIGARARRVQNEHGLALIVVDYIQLLGSHRRYENRTQEVTAQSRGLKLLGKDLGVPVLALSQLSRESERRAGDKRPQLSDLRDSGSLEQDADMVIFVFREEVYKKDRDDLHGIAELILAKQRNGVTGTAKLAFLHKFMRFENLAEDVGYEDEPGPVEDKSGEWYP